MSRSYYLTQTWTTGLELTKLSELLWRPSPAAPQKLEGLRRRGRQHTSGVDEGRRDGEKSSGRNAIYAAHKVEAGSLSSPPLRMKHDAPLIAFVNRQQSTSPWPA